MPKNETKKSSKSTAIAKRKVTDLSTNLIATGRGFENMDQDDLIVPYVKIMQPLSPEVQDDSIRAKQGDLLNSLSQHNYGKSFKFIPLMLKKRRINWIPRDDGGGMLCASIDSYKPDTGEILAKECRICPHSKWLDNKPPACDLIYGFPAIVLGTDQDNKLVIVSFTRTSFGAGKKLLNQMRFAGGDMFGRPYEVTTKKETKKDGTTTYTYFILTAKPAGRLKKAEIDEAEIYFEMLRTMVVRYHEEDTTVDSEESDGPPF